ncbi:hypothetical protein [Alkalimarinus sediminis]|uniref:Uncharacterized protein n=1 Tax=Alkalimarinus sediminis TaxID=1632866 RepID=A0A9E8KR04_9ALTE|nr:hypothetical protein [Alkalimarinus sediminis]UZW75770.1 hypothetical protein NNL22_04055 [Alkalimarinus sediminis]
MSLIRNEIAYQVPQDLARSTLLNPEKGSANQEPANDILPADAVNLRLQQGLNPTTKKISVNDYKDAVGKDSAFIKETLRNKLAEVGMNPEMRLEISKDLFGNFQAKGNGIPSAMEQVNKDLTNNKAFHEAFNRLSTDQPTLDYVDNVVKVANAYGVHNNVFSSLVSATPDNNGLSDIAHRYDALKSNIIKMQSPEEQIQDSREHEGFTFILNG